MTSTLTRALLATALVAVPVITACGATTSTPQTQSSTTADVFGSAATVAAAFATAYAGGDTPTACTYASGAALERLNRNGLCSTRPNWSQAPRQTDTCVESDGLTRFLYRVDSEVDRNLEFAIAAEADSAQRWTVTLLWSVASTSHDPLCLVLSGATETSSAG